jgi:Protein of unknown function (DUF2612)
MTTITVDHSEIGLSRVALQYYESANFRAYITALLQHSFEIEALFQKMALQVDIDIAEGVNLDVIGIIVGRSRIIPLAIPVGFFGFFDQPGVLAYGEEGVLAAGGRFRDETEPAFASSVLADPEYRLLLKAKIIKNHSKGYAEDALAGLSMLFGVPAAVSSIGVMTMQIGVGRELRYWEQVILTDLDLISRPTGVLIDQRVSYDANAYFGFSDQPNAKTFGEEGSATYGGKFANEF